jgi:hypothetical protein
MKHFKLLTDIENVSIRLDVLESTVRVISYGAEEANRQDIIYALHNVSDQLDELSAKLRSGFNELFDAIKEEDNGAGNRKPKKQPRQV